MNGAVWLGRLREAVLGLLLGGAALLIVTEGLSHAEASIRREDPKAGAVREGNRLLERLRTDVAQGPKECRMLPNGVSFRNEAPAPTVTYTWSARSGQVSRAAGPGSPRVVAHGITAFAVATNPDGRVLVTVEASRGQDAAYRRTVRLER